MVFKYLRTKEPVEGRFLQGITMFANEFAVVGSLNRTKQKAEVVSAEHTGAAAMEMQRRNKRLYFLFS